MKFLVDVNLPYYFGLWRSDEYVHQSDRDARESDAEIWDFAGKNDLTIITKDSDFSNRIMAQSPPPRVIHVRLGNMHMQEFHRILNACWDEVLTMNRSHKLVNIYPDRIEGLR